MLRGPWFWMTQGNAMHAERRTAEAVPYVGYARAAVSSTLSCHGGVHSVGVDGRGQAEAAGHLDELAGGGSALVAEEVHRRRRSSPSRARPPDSRGTRCPRSHPPRRGSARRRCSAGPCPRRGSCRRSCSRARRCVPRQPPPCRSSTGSCRVWTRRCTR